ncbi:MAG: DUF2085 domain-containing protein, partial [Anaerolineaceae bacterium]|nr:DUF2085 domain-containing protein [Anaerolineaceae bacterium]
MHLPLAPSKRSRLLLAGLTALCGILLITWLMLTPPGLLGKADAIGYAVCHRIPARSFFLGDRPLPLCARCSGMFLGALLGLVYQLRSGRLGGLPPFKISVVLTVFLVAFGIDGVNSYLQFFSPVPRLYEPQNWLRLLTGSGLGIGIAAVIYPTFSQSVWEDWIPKPALPSWRHLLELGIWVVALNMLILWQNPLVLYPLALLSSATVVLLLTLIHTIVWVLLLKKENAFRTWQALRLFLAAGLCTALLQVAII